MKKEQYEAMRRYLADRPAADKGLGLAARGLTGLVYTSYIAAGLILAVRKSRKLAGYLLVPGTVFVTGSCLRSILNAPRPYEQMDMHLAKGKRRDKGKSFPSRHSFSAAVIAVTFAWLHPLAGLAMGITALAVAATRVLTGVHYLKDVAAGLLFGALNGWLGLLILQRTD